MMAAAAPAEAGTVHKPFLAVIVAGARAICIRYCMHYVSGCDNFPLQQ